MRGTRTTGADPLAAASRLAALATVLAALLAAPPALAGTASPPPQPAPVSVVIPDLAYGARDDTFRVGPFPSLLDVLGNDAGPRAPGTLHLLDGRGEPVDQLRVPRVGVLYVTDGYVRLDPADDVGGSATVRYRAASPRGGTSEGTVRVVASRSVSVLGDEATTWAGEPVAVPVGSNDALLVSGAFRVCGPQLAAGRPAAPDELVVVQADPARPPARPCPSPGVLVTPDGTWSATDDGSVVYSPAEGFSGRAQVWYVQDADNPYDRGAAQVTVEVLAGTATGTPRPGGSQGTTSPPTASPAPAPASASATAVAVAGGPAGRAVVSRTGGLARTGAEAALLAVAGAVLVAAGAGLLVLCRSRRAGRPTPTQDGPLTRHR